MEDHDMVGSQVNEDRYSRQLALYGRETMLRLSESKIFISGVQGLGLEIAKNLILSGVKSVTVHDEGKVTLWDLCSNFLLSESDIGKSRVSVCVWNLQDLNHDIEVHSMRGKLTKEQLSEFQAVVFTDICLEKAIEFSDYCHNHQPPIPFIKTEVRGLFGNVFCDFGPEFTVYDVDGEELHSGIIMSITNGNPAIVFCVDDERLEFQDGDFVVFSEVLGMTELNDGRPRRIISAMPYTFILEEDTTYYGIYKKGGIATQVKQPKILNFKPLEEALRDPGDFLLSDFSKCDRPALLHLAFQALDRFVCEFGRYPVAGSMEDAQMLISITTVINETLEGVRVELNHDILRHFAFGARAVLNPMAAMFGGIASQEVIKACSEKFHPLFQFFYFDSVESLPPRLDPRDLAPLGCRYDAQISVFGSQLQKKLLEANVFMVGSGALGCEFLKNLALMGVSCGDNGTVTITDDDVIEKSNLSTQFLFSYRDVGQFKSTVAAEAVGSINSNFHVVAHRHRLGPNTEDAFDDDFWENLSVVINALDNVSDRLYVDRKCVYFQKPLLESGKSGAKCHTQSVIPHLTEEYGAWRDPSEKETPMCTLQYFPHNIDHCMAWARSEFEVLFEKTPAEVNKFVKFPTLYESSRYNAVQAEDRDILEHVLECVDGRRCITFDDCVTWARLRFEDYFTDRVIQLTHSIPYEAVTSTGVPFWDAPRRFPLPLEFSTSDPQHLEFILSASILRAQTFKIPVPYWADDSLSLAEAADDVLVPEFYPRKGTALLSADSIVDAGAIDQLFDQLEDSHRLLPPHFRLYPIRFEKDDDRNRHMEFITSFANMRARNYYIPEVGKLKAKLFSGKILPSTITTTAIASGLVCLELYKVLDKSHNAEDYRNTFANLALPFFTMSQPMPPEVDSFRDLEWSIWDRWIMRGDPTLQNLIYWFMSKGLKVFYVMCEDILLYSCTEVRHTERLYKKVVDLVAYNTSIRIPNYRNHVDLVVGCEDNEGNDIEVPIVSVHFT